ncbi:MAG: H-type small acid-soluble spore protein [Ectobacillus sp.]
MDMKRAKQILSSPGHIPVEYHGVRVWLENCDESTGTVSVHDVDNKKESVQVNVSELKEL